jgi:hypothetical protein
MLLSIFHGAMMHQARIKAWSIKTILTQFYILYSIAHLDNWGLEGIGLG